MHTTSTIYVSMSFIFTECIEIGNYLVEGESTGESELQNKKYIIAFET